MKIFYDENMPYAEQFFAGFGELIPFAGRELTPEKIADADVLLVRSITKVNAKLLSLNKKLSFVGTATIGIDHIDQAYLASRHITFSSAPGCNAVSVAEYVLSALVILAERYLIDLSQLTIGIVGAGNTGTQLSKKLDALSMSYQLYDPPLEQAGDTRQFASFEQILQCDVISLHVPLTRVAEFPSYHLFNESVLAKLSDKQILINVCRGEVVDNKALLLMKRQGHQLKLIWDVWEDEPNILLDLIAYTDIASAHIAGYSLEGKSAGTELLYQALCQYLDVQPSKKLSEFLPKAAIEHLELAVDFDQKLLIQLVKLVYDVRRDDGIFREIMARQQISANNKTQSFDNIRKNYPIRREFSSLTITLSPVAKSDVPYRLGFTKPSK